MSVGPRISAVTVMSESFSSSRNASENDGRNAFDAL
jgi:hypothetical protein